jgi:GTP pyrophosphokinase
MPVELGERFERALCLATRWHAGQYRKGTEIPYVSHLLAVAALVIEHGGSEDEAIAALLHDAIEDQGGATKREEIREEFGNRVTAIVDGCTDADTLKKPEWRPRKEQYIAHIPDADPSVRLVSSADKLHNARAIFGDLREHGESLWGRFNGGREGTLWYYRSLADAFEECGSTALSRELARTVEQIEALTASTGD